MRGLLLIFLVLLPVSAQAWTEAEREQILSFGPWPPEAARDSSNRLSGNPAAIALGAALFSETRLSPGGIACISCHQPQKGWGDGLARSKGMQQLDRNAPSVMNAHLSRWFGWDGASDSLWAASIRPILDEREMASSAERVAATIRSDAALTCQFEKVAGTAPQHLVDEAVMVLGAKAIAAFQETLTSGRTPFDDYRDALARGENAPYPEAAKRGLKIFLDSACAACHTGPSFSNGEFHDTGLPYFMQNGRPDPGRYEGIKRVRANPYNRLSRYSDDPDSGFTVRHVALLHRNWGEFKTPSLRNLRHTAPYMHDGSKATLIEVIRHYSELDEDRLHVDGEAILRPLRLDEASIRDLAVFLETLSASNVPDAASLERWAEEARKCRK
ncbi:cytochrome c peroxidase [uncultured Ferrovibrio sp.]|jgi:cytochrome c peroxidase|uniref:cytochrome-c peroxidase n=1 Tax=uncultured Ferrovibrio sp. TaxID=1576913 RepID=UPI002629BFF5|nr:cytochrome c peroxidase [uncultured Ferrovibrio sp.]